MLLHGSTCAEKLIQVGKREGTNEANILIAKVKLVDLYKAGLFSEQSFIDISTEALWNKFFGLDRAQGSQPYDFDGDRHRPGQDQYAPATKKKEAQKGHGNASASMSILHG